MRTELLGQEKNIVKIKLEIEPEEFSKAINSAINDLSRQVNIPGFRKGKIPRNILEMRFGVNAIYEEALEKIMPKNINQIIDDYDLDPLDAPKMNVEGGIKEGVTLNCELTFEVKPDVELPDIDNLEIEKVIAKVDEQNIQDLEKRIRVQFAKVNPAEHEVREDNLVDVELTVRVLNPDGSEAQEQPRPTSTHEKINLADQTVRQAVRDALAGKSKGDTVEAVFDVEEAHTDKQLAGKKVKYIMKIEGVSEYEMPEVNEEFFKKVFGDDTTIKTADDYRERLRQDILDEVTRTSDADVHSRALEMVANLSKIELPENIVIRQRARMRAEDEAWAKDNGVAYDVAFGLDSEEGRKGYESLLHSRAEKAVKDAFVIEAVGKKYGVRLESSDIEKAFEDQSKKYGVSKGMIANYFTKNKQDFERFTDDLRLEKIVDVMLSHMKIKEVETLSENNNNTQNNQAQEQ